MNIGEAVRLRIIELSKERGLSISRLCGMSGIPHSTLINIVGGRNAGATIKTIKKVCDGLDISIQDFFSSPLFNAPEEDEEDA